MYDVRWLVRVARFGLADLVPAVRQAFNDDPTDDHLARVYGPSPRRTIVLIAIGGILAGTAADRLLPSFLFSEYILWGPLLLAFVHAALMRRYLFRHDEVMAEDFPWLAASIVPAAALLGVVHFIAVLIERLPNDDAGPFAIPAALLVSAADGLGLAAALAIAVATLCFSRRWPKALTDLAVRLFVFKLTVWLMVLILIEIGIVGPILTRLVEGIFGINIPGWIGDTVDQLSYAAMMGVIYLALIGATWTVCRRSFAELLASGEVHILETVESLAKPPEKRKKKKNDKKPAANEDQS